MKTTPSQTVAQQIETYHDHRRHGAAVSAAAHAAGLDTSNATRLEGRTYCQSCDAYVTDEQCPHWSYDE